MNDQIRDVTQYLSTPTGAFWCWAENGRIITWKRETMITFREELGSILQTLAPKGLPQLDAVLLMIAAIRDGWIEESQQLRGRHKRLSQLFSDLDRIHAFPQALTYSLKAKQYLAEVVFEAVPRVTSPEVAKLVCEVLIQGIDVDNHFTPDLSRIQVDRVQSTETLVAELREFTWNLQTITAESLQLRLSTGLDELPSPTDVIIPAEPAAIRTFLQKLALDEDLAGIARIARQLSAVLHLPRAISDSDEMPLGGVSDISNRGTLDRLLLSELAHDDLTLATRIALNEALYLRRETPPSPPPMRRYVLVDSGLRMWGLPRVFAVGVLLSLASTGAEGSSLLAYRACVDRVEPVDLSSASGLTQHLASLATELHPGTSLSDFARYVLKDNEAGDVVMITSDTAITDPDFQRLLSEFPIAGFYLATVNRMGEFELWSKGRRGAKKITSLKLDLEDLLNRPTPGRQASETLIDSKIDSNLPFCFHTESIPLRFPAQPSGPVWSVRLPDGRQPVRPATPTAATSVRPKYGVMILTRDRRIMLLDESNSGARQVATGVPFGTLLWSGSSEDQRFSHVLIHRASEPGLYLLTINLVVSRINTTQRLASRFLSTSGAGSKLQGATVHAGILFVIFNSMVEAFDLESGNTIDQVQIAPEWTWNGSRFFTNSKGDWRAVSYSSSGICFEKIPLRGPELSGIILRMFDRPGHDGPFGVHLRGSIANLSNQTEWEFTNLGRPQVKVIDISGSGERVLIEQDNEKPAYDGKIHRTRRVVHLDSKKVEVDVNEKFSPWSLRFSSLALWDLKNFRTIDSALRRISRIGLSEDGKLTLVLKTLTTWQFDVSTSGLKLVRKTGLAPLRLTVVLEPAHHPDVGLSLTVARWKDGSRAFVDSRGLLVLQSSDKMIPEAAFVLSETDVTVWTSHSGFCGSAFFLGQANPPKQTPQEIMEKILTPFAERLS
ncbi:MAG: hypothetical protein U0941_20720 [Planctomycetaceae bacterium]